MSDLVNQINYHIVYLAVVLSSSSFLLLRGLFVLRREKKRRIKNTQKMDFSEAVVGPSATVEDLDHSNILSRKTAAEGIEVRFDAMKKFYVPLVLFVTFILVAIPFLPTLSATYLSLFTGLLAGVVGLAARPVIENAIAGMVLTFSQPIRINDTIIVDGHYGTVEKVNLLHTVVKVWNWRRLVIPNHQLIQKEIQNLTLTDEREWAYFSFYVEPTADLNLVKSLAKAAMVSPYLDDSEEPSFWVMEMEKDAILCWVAGWADDASQAWALRSSARKKLVEKMQDHGILFQLANSNIKVSGKGLSFNSSSG